MQLRQLDVELVESLQQLRRSQKPLAAIVELEPCRVGVDPAAVDAEVEDAGRADRGLEAIELDQVGPDFVGQCGDEIVEDVTMREKIDEHHEAAQASGARICFSSGFDSIPFDLGVLMTQNAAQERFGAPSKKSTPRSCRGCSRRERMRPWRERTMAGLRSTWLRIPARRRVRSCGSCAT